MSTPAQDSLVSRAVIGAIGLGLYLVVLNSCQAASKAPTPTTPNPPAARVAAPTTQPYLQRTPKLPDYQAQAEEARRKAQESRAKAEADYERQRAQRAEAEQQARLDELEREQSRAEDCRRGINHLCY